MAISKEKLKKWILWGLGGAFVVGLSSALGVLSVLYFQVYLGDDSYLKKSTILAKINEETSIYYLDEETRIGSFFDEQHRRYVPIDEVPAHMINALIASEDKYFYEHGGINPIAIAKAFAEGFALMLRSGLKTIHFRGGSTITQQTVKNILDRREYSLSRKFREAIASMQLERLYNKRQILEFYLNQFHVAGNGNGVGIAAKYYFNKDVRDLNLVEAAFIAGSVKGPSKYNPFIKYTPEARKRAWKFANQRKNYVLKRMYEQAWIDKEEFRDAWDKPVPFNKGKFTSKEVALVSLVRSQLNKKEILEALNMGSINELNHAGLKVYTTLDHDIQSSAQLMMRRNLSRLETVLQGFSSENEENFKQLRDLEINEFYYGKVEKVVDVDGKPKLLMDFGLPKGSIPYESLVRYAKLLDLAVPKGYKSRLKELLKDIKIGDVLFVEVREYDRETHQAVLELHKRPLVNGAITILDKGELRGVVSGFDPQGYNRAIFGKRQPGSVFKSVTYFAALQLGWTILDRLDNERRVFPYQGQFYYPRPDHASPYRDTSMIWSGTKSENLASIYLTSNLIEKLSFEQFKGLLGAMDLAPKESEAERDFHYRVARAIGVQLTNEGIREFELGNAVRDLAPDLVFAGEQKTLNKLDKMWWGRGYAAELQRLYVVEDEEVSDKEKLLRIELVKNNFQRHTLLASNVEEDWNRIRETVEIGRAEAVFSDPEVKNILARFRVIPGRGNRPALGYFRTYEEEEPKDAQNLAVTLTGLPGRAMNSLDVQSIWGKGGLFTASANINLADVRLAGYLPLKTFRGIGSRLQQRYNAVLAYEDSSHDLYRYYHHHDFRIALGLNYLKVLCEQMGVFSRIEPVLSFPLGTNVVSVLEVAKVYQTLIDGRIYRFYKEGPANQINLIRRVEDRFGNVLLEPERQEHQLVLPEYAQQTRQILRKVVTHGTGSRARGELYIKLALDPNNKKVVPIRIPAFGKTGTTNDYTTASFAGFIPYPVTKRARLDPRNSYVLSAYVGYDFNREMRRGGLRVSGAQGALPAWTDLAKDILDKKAYIDFLDRLDLKVISRQEWPMTTPAGTVGVSVDLPRGLVLRSGEVAAERFEVTDLGVSGEEYVNEFALNASVKSYVRVPIDASSGAVPRPLRKVTFFDPPEVESDDENPAPTADEVQDMPTQVEPNAARNVPGIDAVTPQDVSLSGESEGLQKTQPSTQSAPTIQAVRTSRPNRPVANPRTGRSNQQNLGNSSPSQPTPQPGPIDSPDDEPGFIEEELW